MLPIFHENENPEVRRCCVNTQGNLNLSFIYLLSLFLSVNAHLVKEQLCSRLSVWSTDMLGFWKQRMLICLWAVSEITTLCSTNVDLPLLPREKIDHGWRAWALGSIFLGLRPCSATYWLLDFWDIKLLVCHLHCMFTNSKHPPRWSKYFTIWWEVFNKG